MAMNRVYLILNMITAQIDWEKTMKKKLILMTTIAMMTLIIRER